MQEVIIVMRNALGSALWCGLGNTGIVCGQLVVSKNFLGSCCPGPLAFGLASDPLTAAFSIRSGRRKPGVAAAGRFAIMALNYKHEPACLY